MSENLHSEDEYFRQAYKNLNQRPSPEVWKAVSERVVQKKALYKQNMVEAGAKRMAFVVLLMLSSLALRDGLLWHNFPSKNVTGHNSAAPEKQGQEQALANTTTRRRYTQHPVIKLSFHNKNEYSNEWHRQSKSLVYHYNYHRVYFRPQSAAVVGERTVETVQNSPLKNAFALQYNAILPVKDSAENNNRYITADLLQQPLSATPPGAAVAAKNAATFSLSKTASGSKKTNDKSGWQVMPFASVDFMRFELDDDVTYTGTTQVDKKYIQEKEGHESSFSAGVLATHFLSQKIGIKTGLVYTNIIVGIQPQTLYATKDANQNTAFQFNTSSGYAYVRPLFGSTPLPGDSITSTQGKHHLNYLAVPAMVSYVITQKNNLSLRASAGINTSFLLSSKIETEVNNNTNEESVVINKLIGLRPVYFSFIADVDVQYKISKRFTLTFTPTAKYAFTSLTKNYVVKTFPYSLGAGVGVGYRF